MTQTARTATPAAGGREFVVARNPDRASRLPYLLQVPVAGAPPLVLATSVPWPQGKDAYCHVLEGWPEGAEVLERVPVEVCRRRGAAVDLVLRRRRARRSLFVFTRDRRRGRPLVFWRTAATLRQARPGVRVPTARGLERALEIAVDGREQHPWRFARYDVRLVRRELPVGDYGVVVAGRLLAAVERKSPPDLAAAAIDGRLTPLLAELSSLPRAALVVEGRLSAVMRRAEEAGVRTGWLLNVLAALQVEHPAVTWMFAETRDLAQDWAYRWLAAALRQLREEPAGLPVAAAEGPGTFVPDAPGRRTEALRQAQAGVEWTSRAYAAAFGVRPVTAWKDLRTLVAEGWLEAIGGRRGRRYRWAGGPGADGGAEG